MMLSWMTRSPIRMVSTKTHSGYLAAKWLAARSNDLVECFKGHFFPAAEMINIKSKMPQCSGLSCERLVLRDKVPAFVALWVEAGFCFHLFCLLVVFWSGLGPNCYCDQQSCLFGTDVGPNLALLPTRVSPLTSVRLLMSNSSRIWPIKINL